MQTEKQLQVKIVKYLKDTHNAFVRKTVTTASRGFPDLVVIMNGHTFFLELKHPNGKGVLSKLQEITINQMKEHGAHVYVVNSLEQVKTIIKERFTP